MMGLGNSQNDPQPTSTSQKKSSNQAANNPNAMANIITSQQLFAHEQKLLQ